MFGSRNGHLDDGNTIYYYLYTLLADTSNEIKRVCVVGAILEIRLVRIPRYALRPTFTPRVVFCVIYVGRPGGGGREKIQRSRRRGGGNRAERINFNAFVVARNPDQTSGILFSRSPRRCSRRRPYSACIL